MHANANHRRTAVPETLPNVAEALLASPSLAECRHLLSASGLDEMLRGSGPFTLFAPTNEAFDHLAEATRQQLTDPKRLREVLEYHMLAGLRERTGFANSKFKTLNGAMLTACVTDDGLRIDHANTRGKAISCSNGVIHPIDAVLVPGFTPVLSKEARADSAWTGRRIDRSMKSPAKDASWPFVEAKPLGKASGAD